MIRCAIRGFVIGVVLGAVLIGFVYAAEVDLPVRADIVNCVNNPTDPRCKNLQHGEIDVARVLSEMEPAAEAAQDGNKPDAGGVVNYE